MSGRTCQWPARSRRVFARDPTIRGTHRQAVLDDWGDEAQSRSILPARHIPKGGPDVACSLAWLGGQLMTANRCAGVREGIHTPTRCGSDLAGVGLDEQRDPAGAYERAGPDAVEVEPGPAKDRQA